MADPRFFSNKGPLSLSHIAQAAGCVIHAPPSIDAQKIMIDDVAAIDTAGPGHLCFLDNVRYKKHLSVTKAGACILHPKMLPDAPATLVCLVTEAPYKAYAIAAALFYPESVHGPLRGKQENRIHPSAVISPSATIGKGVTIGPFAFIGDGVQVGAGTMIAEHVTLSHTVIGSGCAIHTGARIGQTGFGFAADASGPVPVPQLGRVIIGNHVRIGANTCIDRGAGPDTVIGDGTIIDNLVQIAHNVHIGKGCVIVSQVGISGSTRIEDYCVLGGQAGVAGHLTIGKGAQIGAQSGVTKDVGPGEKLMGFPARPIREFWREMAGIKKLLSK